MAALIKSLKLVNQITSRSPGILYTVSRNAGHWNKDFKPGSFPETKEQQEAAAKKYYLLPQEYQPYADDGLGYGDYPKLPAGPKGMGMEAKDPYYPYDLPELKRNFNEPIHADVDVYGEDRYSQPDVLRYPMWRYWATFMGVMTFCIALYYWLEDKKMFRPVIPKQYPADGKKHYTFEPLQTQLPGTQGAEI